MIYTITVFGLFCIVVLVFAGKNFVWLISQSEQYKPYFPTAPMIIEKAYRAVDLKADWEYTDLIKFEQMRGRRSFDYFDHQTVLVNSEHFEHHKEKMCHELTKEMLNRGMIEIVNQVNEYDPSRHRVQMRVKVYQPES